VISFEDELPLPEVNLKLYRELYVLEQWLRRIALAAFMARYGTRWNDAIPTEIGKNLRSRVKQLRNRVAFDTENSDNAIWCLTLDELKALLTYEKVWSLVRNLTAFDRQELGARLDDLREIRNVVGHNRAATDYTQKIFEAIDESLRKGIEQFRDRFLYDFAGEQHAGDLSGDAVADAFYTAQSPLGSKQIARDDYFYYIYVLMPESGSPIKLGDLLEHFDSIRRIALAFLVNRQTLGEYTLVWPTTAKPDEHSAVLQQLERFESRPGDPYDLQSPKYVCHPKVWFVY
jgi:hypothetical protein